MRSIALPGGGSMPALGLGTWRMGENARAADGEVAALKAGIDLGVRLIDTAEMYGEGGAERVVARAVAGRREEIFIVSKVYPHNASRKGAIEACERSLRRLGTDRIDLYLLHWRGSHPLEGTVEAFEALRAAGKILRWGVSNFDSGDMADLDKIAAPGACAANQVLYHLGERGIEGGLLGECGRRGMPVMAYSPLGQTTILDHPVLGAVAHRHGVSPATIAVAWTLRTDGVVSIPKTARADRVPALVAAAELELEPADISELDGAFPPPRGRAPLAML